MEETCNLDGLFRYILQIAYDVLRLPMTAHVKKANEMEGIPTLCMLWTYPRLYKSSVYPSEGTG